MTDRSLNGRDDLPNLLALPPTGSREFVAEWSQHLIDPVMQLKTLADLFEDGLISRAEYERYKGRVRDL